MPPTRKLKENKALPKRWRLQHGAYYYQVPPKQREKFGGKYSLRLGATLAEAYRTWATYCEAGETKTFGDLLDRYLIEEVPLKSPASQRSNHNSAKFLRAAFGKSDPASIKPVHVYQYRDARSKAGKTTCNRDLEMMSHIFTKAIQWGVVETHPIKGKVLKNPSKARTRLITDAEFDLFYNDYATPMIQSYILLKLIMPLRKSDILRLKIADLQDDGIHAFNTKSNRPIIFEWSDELHAAIKKVRDNKRVVGFYLFCTKSGQPYIDESGLPSGFNSIWQRCMQKFKKAGHAGFWEHDIRALAASESETLEIAQKLLNHASASVTRKHYRRNVEVITPHKSKKLDGKL